MTSMKTLYESILDDEDEVMDTMGEDPIHYFLSKNYRSTIKYVIKKVSGEYIVDVNSNAYIENSKESTLTGGIFKFGKINGSFNINNCPNIINLIGSPKEVGGGMSIMNCDKLESFKGSPEKVNGAFFCSNCNKITTLEGSPKEIGGDFNCSNCKNIKSIKGLPEKVKKFIYLPSNNLSWSDEQKIKDINNKNILKFRKYR